MTSERERALKRFQKYVIPALSLKWSMAFLLGMTFLTGYLGNFLLLSAGVTTMTVRFPIALAISYGAFFLWVWAWLKGQEPYERPEAVLKTGSLDRYGPVYFSAILLLNEHEQSNPQMAAVKMADAEGNLPVGEIVDGAGDGLSSLSSLDEGGIVLLVLAVLGLCILGVQAYLISVAPELLSEALFEFSLVTYPTARCQEWRYQPSWAANLFRNTALPFVIMLVLTLGIGHLGTQTCPKSATILQVVDHCQGHHRDCNRPTYDQTGNSHTGLKLRAEREQ